MMNEEASECGASFEDWKTKKTGKERRDGRG